MQVQHLIERCLLLHMTLDQCIKALQEHASIRPLITLTGSSLTSSPSLSLCVCVWHVIWRVLLAPSWLVWSLFGLLFVQFGESYKRRTGISFMHTSMLFLLGPLWVSSNNLCSLKYKERRRKKEKDPLIISQNGSTYTNYLFHVVTYIYVRIILLVNLSQVKYCNTLIAFFVGRHIHREPRLTKRRHYCWRWRSLSHLRICE